jgi:hypothetical protein
MLLYIYIYIYIYIIYILYIEEDSDDDDDDDDEDKSITKEKYINTADDTDDVNLTQPGINDRIRGTFR